MADAVIARQQGDDFQARLFWLHAAQLMDDSSSVVRVAFESGPKAFDDVVIDHAAERAPQDHYGKPMLRDHLQCKWHVKPGDFGYRDFTDPAFSGGSSVSILQRVLAAQREHAPKGEGARFQLVTNWNALPPFRALIRNQNNDIDIDALFTGGSRSAMGEFRATWAGHLGIDEGELRTVVRTLGVNLRIRSGEDIRAHLNDRLARYGLKPIPTSEAGFAYDDLVRKFHAQGRKVFDRKSFRDMVREENLIAGPPPALKTVIGVRSFMHPIDSIEARTTTNLNLVPFFDGRYLRDEASWNSTLYPALKDYLVAEAAKVDHVQLILDAHVSLAYAVGSILDVKSGKTIEIEQRTGGRRFWSTSDVTAAPDWPKLTTTEEALGKGGEVAVAISLTHDVLANVRTHVTASLPQVGSIVAIGLEGGPSFMGVKSGAHASTLAEAVSAHVRQLAQRARVHLFIAGPNGFTFFLGQHHRVMRPVTLYEWDFDGLRGRGYSEGLSLL